MTDEADSMGEDPLIVAGEFALGLLEGDALDAAEARIATDPDFARSVAQWRMHFAVLFEDGSETDAPDAVEARLLASLASLPESSSTRWRVVAAAFAALAAGLLVVLLIRPAEAPLAPRTARPATLSAPLLAALVPSGKGEPVAAFYDRAQGEVRVAAATLTPATRSAELWVIGADTVPHSLGILARGAASRIAVPADQRARLADGATLAVTDEAPGGSPTGKPQGPILVAGTLSGA